MLSDNPLPVERGYVLYQRNEISYDEYKRDYAEPEEHKIRAMKLNQLKRNFR